jgi:hypothetical protein
MESVMALTKCNTEHAPWPIVPSERKWYRNLVVSTLLREALEKMDPQFPPEEPGLERAGCGVSGLAGSPITEGDATLPRAPL